MTYTLVVRMVMSALAPRYLPDDLIRWAPVLAALAVLCIALATLTSGSGRRR